MAVVVVVAAAAAAAVVVETPVFERDRLENKFVGEAEALISITRQTRRLLALLKLLPLVKSECAFAYAFPHYFPSIILRAGGGGYDDPWPFLCFFWPQIDSLSFP